MGALMRARAWDNTAVGHPSTWPQSLRTAVRLLLNTRHPMYVFWGAELTCFYNDAYRQSIGSERHPSSLGQPGRDVWDEIWPIIGPQIDQVMLGHGATWHENQLVPITRDGHRDDVYWTYGYGPIDDEHAPHGVGGVLVVCTETTQQVETVRRLGESEQRLQIALSAGRGVGTWDWDVQNDRVVADQRFATLYGVDTELARCGAPVEVFFRGVHPDDLPGLRTKVADTLETGAPFSAEYRLVNAGRPCWVIAEGRCDFSSDGKPIRFPGVSFDITERETTELRLQELNGELERKVIERSQTRGKTWQLSPDLLGALNGAGIFRDVQPCMEGSIGVD